MWVTFSLEDGSRTERLEIDGKMEVSLLKQVLEATFAIPAEQQGFICEGKSLEDTGVGTVESIGIKNEDFVIVINAGTRTGTVGGGSVDAQHQQQRAGPRPGSAGSSMSLDEVFAQYKNPRIITRMIRSDENLMKQLHYHYPSLAAAMAGDEETAVRALTKNMLSQVMKVSNKNHAEQTMKQRLENNPNDAEAKEYFQKKQENQMHEELRLRTLEEFPESFVPVLMLYIQVEINGTPLQAFVDSGAQTSVISGKCAERCGLTPYIDSRFAGTVVGVGNGRTLGRVLYTNLKIEGRFFPISLTVMDDSQGLGDKNMEFLLGLDMLKRHQCVINLVQGRLQFTYKGQAMSTPFLFEKDLPKTKGGTKDYNASEDSK